jgi:CheY-like chemotaxis protein
VAKRIAVINDDTVFLALLHDLLSEEGYETHLFHEGAACYEQVRELDPHVIILDIRMESPASGWKVLELFKLDPVLTRRPIVVCSADLTQLQDRAAYLKSKGCEILPKPFDLDDLLSLLVRLAGQPG